MTQNPEDADWASVTWEGAEQATLHDGMKMTFAQKVRWLEETQRLVDAGGRREQLREDPPGGYGSNSKDVD